MLAATNPARQASDPTVLLHYFPVPVAFSIVAPPRATAGLPKSHSCWVNATTVPFHCKGSGPSIDEALFRDMRVTTEDCRQRAIASNASMFAITQDPCMKTPGLILHLDGRSLLDHYEDGDTVNGTGW